MEPKTGRVGMLHVVYGASVGRFCATTVAGPVSIIPYRLADWCILSGGLRVNQALVQEVLEAIGGEAVEVALAAQMQRDKQWEQHRALEMEAEAMWGRSLDGYVSSPLGPPWQKGYGRQSRVRPSSGNERGSEHEPQPELQQALRALGPVLAVGLGDPPRGRRADV